MRWWCRSCCEPRRDENSVGGPFDQKPDLAAGRAFKRPPAEPSDATRVVASHPPSGHSGVAGLWNRGTGRDAQSDMGRVALSLIAAGMLSSCGGSSPPPEAAETLVSGPLTTDVTSPAQPPSTPPSSSTQPAMTTDEPAIVAAAVARLTDQRFGGDAVLDRVNIVERYGTPNSDAMLDVGSDSPLMGAGVRAAVEHALAPMVVTWVDSINDVIGSGQEIPSYEEVGVVLTLRRRSSTAGRPSSPQNGGAVGPAAPVAR